MRSPRTFTLNEIARLLDGELIGPGDIPITGLSPLGSAVEGDISFLTRAIYRDELGSTKASAVILGSDNKDATSLPRIVCKDPYLAYARLATAIAPPRAVGKGVHPLAHVHPSATLGPEVSIGPFSVIGAKAILGARVIVESGCAIGEGVNIGEDSDIKANVSVYPGCRVGARALLHSGAVIGADGFGMAREGEGWRKIPQLGGVWIGDDVEIGANTTVDRGALEDTIIEDGVKLDNQIQIAHNVRIGAHSAFAGCVGIAGSTKIGRRCTIGGGSVVLGHLHICDDTHIMAASVVTKSIQVPGEYAGLYPLQERATWARNAVLLKNLEKIVGRRERQPGLGVESNTPKVAAKRPRKTSDKTKN
jgi:UDP-3-O-[3-hydroxymyristoyl] glucosamine N-acyltransferase